MNASYTHKCLQPVNIKKSTCYGSLKYLLFLRKSTEKNFSITCTFPGTSKSHMHTTYTVILIVLHTLIPCMYYTSSINYAFLILRGTCMIPTTP